MNGELSATFILRGHANEVFEATITIPMDNLPKGESHCVCKQTKDGEVLSEMEATGPWQQLYAEGLGSLFAAAFAGFATPNEFSSARRQPPK